MGITYSSDSRLVAGLTQDWHLGIWETSTGDLRMILDVPQGEFADNAAVAFDKNGTRLAYVGGTHAVIYDAVTGRTLSTRSDLPPGFTDRLIFSPTGELLSFRVETEDGKGYPAVDVSYLKHPRVCRIRNLSGKNPLTPIAEIKDLNAHIFGAAFSPDAKRVIVDGRTQDEKGTSRSLLCLDLKSGTRWMQPSRNKHYNYFVKFHVDGQSLVANLDTIELVAMDLETGKRLGVLKPEELHIWLGNRYTEIGTIGGQNGIELRHGGSPTQLITLTPDVPLHSLHFQFNKTETLLACANLDGSLLLADLPELNRQLTEVGLGW